jgi:hypothetical protein
MNSTTEVVERIEIYSQWVGFANPPSRAAKVILTRTNDNSFVREWALTRVRDEIPLGLIGNLLENLSRAPVLQLDPNLFDFPESVLREHYGSVWTDDYESHGLSQQGECRDVRPTVQ